MATTRPAPAATGDSQPAEPPPGDRPPADADAILRRAVEEAARLLRTDGAMSYVFDDETGGLRFAHDAGITDDRRRAWVRSIKLKIGTGMFGQAVAEGRVVVTGDYLNDQSFTHFADADRLVRDIDIHSFVVAPLVSGGRTYGAMGTFASRADAFGDADVALVRALADHAAAAMANADLIKQLGQAKADVERRAETERALREIGGRIIALRHPEEVLQRSVDEAARLLGADGARIDILDEGSGALYWAYDATTGRRPGLGPIGGSGEAKAGEGISGRAVREMRAVFTGDYLNDDRFEHASAPDEHVRKYAIRSVVAVPLIGGEGPLGTLTVYTGETNAFTPDDARLIEALAGQAAIAMTNAKLIEELDQSRAEFSRRADAERALREIAARITAIRDPAELLQHVVDEAARLLNASRARIDLIMPAAGRVGFTHIPGAGDGIGGAAVDEQGRPFTYGASGKAIALARTVVSTDYFADDGFEHDPGLDEAVRNDGIRSLIVTPLTGEEGLLGVLQVGWPEVGAFDPEEVGLVEAFAHQAAIAIQNARLIEANARSRVEIGRRADAERAVREIAADISALRDAEAILQKTVNEARRLLDSDSARIDMLEGDTLTWAFAAGEDAVRTRETGLDLTFKVGEGVAGRVVVDGEAFRTGDYLADERFEHILVSDKLVEVTGFRSVLSAPLRGEAGPLGALSVSSHRVDAYDDAQAGLLQALADQAAIAIQNARLIAELNRSHDELERRADAQQSLREIAAKITAIRESGPLLQQVVDAAKRLVGADGAVLDLVDIEANLLRWTYDSGVRGVFTDEEIAELTIPIGIGATGIAVAEGRTVTAGDDLGAHFPASEINDRFFGVTGYRSMIVAPITGESGPLGALEVYSTRPGAFDDDDAAVIRSLAYQAAIAITNARLIQELERSQAAVEARAERERSLRDITARITSLREPDEILARVVEESRRLLRSDGAHLTRMADEGTYLVPVIVAGEMDEATERWLKSMKFSLGSGINGLAAQEVRPIWTYDYDLDPRIPHDPDDNAAAERLGLRGMAAAPLRSPGGEVIGTLAISYREPREIAPDELDLLQGLADQAAIALTNSNLYELLGESEGRYRHLVQNSPDLVWSIDADARFSFVSDTCERLTGWRPEDLLGKHFGALVHGSSQEVAELDWTAGVTTEFQELRGRVNLLHRDGHAIPAEFSAFATLDPDGTFAGANGSVRDMSERDRLEGELRASEERYRFLVENSPDVIYAVDADGRFTYVSETVRRGLGYDPDDLVGQSFSSIVHYEDPDSQGVRFRELQADPTLEITSRLNLIHADGRLIPFEVSAVAATRDGRFDGIHGSARDMSERDRLERELRESEERYRFLVENSPDVVFATDAAGLYTYYSESVEQLTGYRPSELVGRHFSSIVDMETFPDAAEAWARFVADPSQMQVNRFALTDREGRRYPVEVSAIGMTDADGRFAGIHGSARDMRERDRLEGELRASAGELASSQERAHLARELHDSVTQALFSMTLVTRTTELLVDRDPSAAKEKLGSLRDLQREALAEMRALIFELRPGNIEQDGLLAALKTHSAALQGRIGLPIVVTSNLVDRLPLGLEEVLYRICQEALHNIVKHAAARQVTLSIERTPGGLLVRIVDDGKGFAVGSVPDGHLGLAGMRARAEKIGAAFAVTSKPGAGTTIAVTVPAAAIAAAGATAPVTTGLSSDE